MILYSFFPIFPRIYLFFSHRQIVWIRVGKITIKWLMFPKNTSYFSKASWFHVSFRQKKKYFMSMIITSVQMMRIEMYILIWRYDYYIFKLSFKEKKKTNRETYHINMEARNWRALYVCVIKQHAMCLRGVPFLKAI